MSAAESPFGFRLRSTSADVPAAKSSRPARVIGTIHGDDFQVVEFDDDATTAVLDAATGAVHPLNRDRRDLEEFLDAFRDYLRSGADDSGPTVMTADQAAQRIAALRAGRITPARRPKPPVSQRERATELRRRLEEIDRAALRPGGWWHKTLEEIDDALL